MGSSGPVSVNILAVGYILDNLEVDDKIYFIERIKILMGAKISKINESIKDG